MSKEFMSKEFEKWYDGIDHPGPVGYARRAFDAGVMSVSPNLRDQFAMSALQGLMANPSYGTISPVQQAWDAYEYADAMLKERDKR